MVKFSIHIFLLTMLLADIDECTVIASSGNTYIVNLTQKSCTCGVWRDTDIPCSHSIAFIAKKGLREHDFASPLFTVKSFKEFYAKGIPAIDFENLKIESCNMPHALKPCGRPKHNRIPSLGEEGAVYHKSTCRLCKASGHNRRRCPLNKDEE